MCLVLGVNRIIILCVSSEVFLFVYISAASSFCKLDWTESRPGSTRHRRQVQNYQTTPAVHRCQHQKSNEYRLLDVQQQVDWILILAICLNNLQSFLFFSIATAPNSVIGRVWTNQIRHQAPCCRTKGFEFQPKLVLIHRFWKNSRPIWPD